MCLLGIDPLCETLKRAVNDSQTYYQLQQVKVTECNICLAGTCLLIHAQLSTHPGVTKTHWKTKLPLKPAASTDIEANCFSTRLLWILAKHADCRGHSPPWGRDYVQVIKDQKCALCDYFSSSGRFISMSKMTCRVAFLSNNVCPVQNKRTSYSAVINHLSSTDNFGWWSEAYRLTETKL